MNCSSSNGEEFADVPAAAPAAVAPSSAAGSTLHLAASFDGPWTPVLSGGLPACNNPSPLLHTNGTWFVLCDSNTLYRLGGAAAFGAPVGTWTQIARLSPSGGVPGNYEDAFIFIDDQDPPTWKALFHIWTSTTNITSCTNTTVSGLAFSRDGLEWTFSERSPYTGHLVFSDGSEMTLPTRERPKLLFDTQRRPTHLVNGACGGVPSCLPMWCSHCKQTAWDFTLVQPLAY